MDGTFVPEIGETLSADKAPVLLARVDFHYTDVFYVSPGSDADAATISEGEEEVSLCPPKRGSDAMKLAINLYVVAAGVGLLAIRFLSTWLL